MFVFNGNMFDGNMQQPNFIQRIAQICAEHFACNGCPLVDNVIQEEGATLGCATAQIRKAERNQAQNQSNGGN